MQHWFWRWEKKVGNTRLVKLLWILMQSLVILLWLIFTFSPLAQRSVVLRLKIWCKCWTTGNRGGIFICLFREGDSLQVCLSSFPSFAFAFSPLKSSSNISVTVISMTKSIFFVVSVHCNEQIFTNPFGFTSFKAYIKCPASLNHKEGKKKV